MHTDDYISLEDTYGVHNYHPLPVVLAKGRGEFLWDVEGRRYLDFLSAYSAVNQGHRHPVIIAAAKKQLRRLTLTSRAFHNDRLGHFEKKLADFTGFPKVLPMNTGAEAVETALKAARRWGTQVKGIADGSQRIIVAEGNFHGRTLAAVSLSTDPDSYRHYGPWLGGIDKVPFGDLAALEAALKPETAGVLLEPIQGEAGVVLPPEGYLKAVRELCTRKKVLFILDEVQTGFCRTGKKFAWEHEAVRPDLMALGKALGGGVLPVSALVGIPEVMDLFTPGTHGSTFGGNPLAAAVGLASMEVLEKEDLAERARVLGHLFRESIAALAGGVLLEVRGRGLLNAAVFQPDFDAGALAKRLMKKGLLCKQTHGHILRFAPPLTIRRSSILKAAEILSREIKG